MSEWKESKFSRALWTAFFVGSVFKISGDTYGKAHEQPWWGVVLTCCIALFVGLFAWTQYRIFTKDQ